MATSRFETHPGGDLVSQGVEDLRRGQATVPSLLVSIGAPRLRRAGIVVPTPLSSPERRLYELLSHEDPDAAHSRYNALVRRLVSFERAAECVR
jgi:hypothetical protein